MANDGSGITDDVQADLNPDDDFGEFTDSGPAAEQSPAPERPANGANKAKWLDYVASLGVDRDFLEGNTEHYDDSKGERMPSKALTRDELIELADRLEG
jgi:hypothetical protein